MPNYDAARELAAFQAQRARGISVRQLGDGSWMAFDRAGGAMHLDAKPDPVEAIEKALANLAAGEQKTGRTDVQRLYQAFERGPYGLTHRQGPQQPDGTSSRQWIVFLASDRSPVGQPFAGLRAALDAIADLVGEPATPQAAAQRGHS
jgi:hypothetical protein